MLLKSDKFLISTPQLPLSTGDISLHFTLRNYYHLMDFVRKKPISIHLR